MCMHVSISIFIFHTHMTLDKVTKQNKLEQRANNKQNNERGREREMLVLTAPQEPHVLTSPEKVLPHLGQEELCILSS